MSITTVRDNALRVPRGVPTGGQFSASARGEGSLSLVPPHQSSLASLVPRGGHATLRDDLLGASAPFHVLDITEDPNSPGFHVEARTSANLIEGLARETWCQQGGDVEDVEMWHATEKAAEEWLHANAADVAAWTQDVYGASMDLNNPHKAQHFSTSARLGPDATVGAAVEAAHKSRIGEVDAALRSGEFFARVLDEAPMRD